MLCPRCSHAISDDAKFCTYCGNSMQSKPVPVPPAPAPAVPAYVAPAPTPAPAPAPVQAPVQGIGPSSPQLPPLLANIIQLAPNEQMMQLIGAAVTDAMVTMNEEGESSDFTVYLLVTNQRLQIIQSIGLFKKGYKVMDWMVLEQIKEVTVNQGTMSRTFNIIFDRNGMMNSLKLGNPFFVNPDGLKNNGAMDPELVRNILNDLVERRKSDVRKTAPAPVPVYVPPAPVIEVPAPSITGTVPDVPVASPPTSSVQVRPPLPEPVVPAPTAAAPIEPPKMSFSALFVKLDAAGILVRAYHCDKCGSMIVLPPQGLSLQCAGCQKEITAEAINDRIRTAFQKE
jgi:uncharacterized OB-fold protein